VNVDVPTPDGVANAYLAWPDDQPHPGILFIMDAFGLRPAIEEMVDRIAEWGYVVLAPNVFYRGGRDPVHPVEDPEKRSEYFASTIRPLMEQLTPERLAADGKAYLDALAEAGATEPVAITAIAWAGASAGGSRRPTLSGSPRSRASMSAVSSATIRRARICPRPTCTRRHTGASRTRTRA